MIRLATVFSGIGSVEHALKRMGLDYKVVFACDNGDVDILSKEIKDNIKDIYNERELLNTIIKSNKDFSYENNGSSLNNDLEKISRKFDEIINQLTNIPVNKPEQFIDSIIIKMTTMNNVKNSKLKKYKEFKISKFNCNDDIYKAYIIYEWIKIVIELVTDYSKKDAKDEVKIEWDKFTDELNVINMFNIEEFKQVVKEIKEISTYVSMLHEKIKTFDIISVLKDIESFKEKNKYVNSLYKGKEGSNYVKKSYLANYDINPEDFHWNVSFLNGMQYEGQVDLFVGGSPCQSFSLVGKQRGLDDTRGTLFYEYARLISEIKPKVFIYENVKAVLSNDGGRTWDTMKKVFEDLGYSWKMQVLNARDYGIPQNRERIFVIGFREDLLLNQEFSFPEPVILEKKMQDFLLDNVSGKYYLNSKGVKFVTDDKNLAKRYTQIDGEIQLCQKKNQQFNWHGDFVFVEENKDMEKTIIDLEKYFLSEKVEKYVMSSGTKNFYSKPKIDLEVARPLLTTMHKMHRAGVDNYVTTKGRLRKLTPRECLRLMGYCDSFKIVVSDTQMYQQAGNSIVVDVMIAIVQSIQDTGVFDN